MGKTLTSLIIYPFALVVFGLSAGIYLFCALFISPRRLHPLARLISRVFLLASGQWVTISGPTPDPKKGPYLYMFNHQSLFDGFLLVAVARHYITGVGAIEQFSYPIWGRIVRRYGVVPIKRKELQDAIHSLDQMEQAISAGTSCLISPEGTRTLTGELGPFKKGPFHVAKNTGVTIIPLGIIGAFEAKPKTDWRIRPGCIRINIGDQLPIEKYRHLSLEELRDFVKEKISKLADQG